MSGFLIIFNNYNVSKNDHTRMFNAEVVSSLGGEEAPHLVASKANTFVGSDVGRRSSDLGAVHVDGVTVAIKGEIAGVEERLSINGGRHDSFRHAFQEVSDPGVIRDCMLTAADV